ncbi:S1 family peptidase [Streptomyces sp. B1866]|uniref:S1 family peptidase n=1 Tax=Streptomyces sp. B1866 TaxID=3075431 RepID=UPI0028904339|nr:S1 family peptidase [Streptomyces sp. B1866]MDT3398284.1 S1 family peptidase [Streptomyces sp. B1866]
MKIRRTSPRSAIVAGVLALASAVLAAPGATAAPAQRPDALSAAAANALSTRITDSLDGATAGSYYAADSRHLVVNVLDERSAAAVRRAGAEAKVVKHSLAQLDRARATLREKATIPGTSWSVDPRTDKVVVTADRTVRGAALARLTAVARGLGDRVEVRRSAGRFTTFIGGGDAIWGDSGRCSLGFNVVKDGQPYFLTAGHCTEAIRSWSASQGGPVIGVNAGSNFPGHDYGLVKYTADVPHPSEIDLYGAGTQPITAAGDAAVGQQVTRSGSTTQVHSGQVTGLDATVNYEEGTVTGLIQTDVCAEPGDSGGSLFAGSTAVGLTSGGSGNCSSGGETFFQPVTAALAAFGAQIG